MAGAPTRSNREVKGRFQTWTEEGEEQVMRELVRWERQVRRRMGEERKEAEGD